MEVGDDVAAGADDDAGAERLGGHVAAARTAGTSIIGPLLAEEAVEPVLHAVVAVAALIVVGTAAAACGGDPDAGS